MSRIFNDKRTRTLISQEIICNDFTVSNLEVDNLNATEINCVTNNVESLVSTSAPIDADSSSNIINRFYKKTYTGQWQQLSGASPVTINNATIMFQKIGRLVTLQFSSSDNNAMLIPVISTAPFTFIPDEPLSIDFCPIETFNTSNGGELCFNIQGRATVVTTGCLNISNINTQNYVINVTNIFYGTSTPNYTPNALTGWREGIVNYISKFP